MIGIRGRSSRGDAFRGVAVVGVIAGATDELIGALRRNQPHRELWPDFAPRGGAIGLVHGQLTELIGNLVWFTSATCAVIRSWTDSRFATLRIGLVAAWGIFATVRVFALVRLNGRGTA